MPKTHFPSSTDSTNTPPQPTAQSTLVLLVGLILAFVSIDSSLLPSGIASQVAIIVAVALIISVLIDARRGWKNLLRTDLVCLGALYYLSLAEFLVPQASFNQRLSSEQTVEALYVLLTAFACLAISRHWDFSKSGNIKWLDFNNIPDKVLFRLFVVAALLGYLYLLWSVRLNIFKAINAMLGPRFSQPWARGRYGGALSLVSELQLFRYVIPPLGAILINRRQSISKTQLIVVILVVLFTLFDGFAGGTRSVFSSYMAGFLVAYFLTLPRFTFWNTFIPTGIASYALVFATRHMLGFRNMGIRRYILSGGYLVTAAQEQQLAVDYNLWSMAMIIDAMPSKYDFLGFELVYVFFSKPIPRFFWPDKPENLSVSIEDIVGAEAWTVAATYVGESYMIAGLFSVIIVSILIGMTANWWTKSVAIQPSGYGKTVSALGFFVAALIMRSLSVFTTIILPIFALIFFAKVVPGWLGIKQPRKT